MSPRRARHPEASDSGSAVIEFITVGVLLLTPLVYVTIVMGRLQAASFAADGSARAAARAFVTAANDEDGRRRAALAVRLGLLDQGFADQRDADLTVECEVPGDCLAPGSRIRVLVQVRVRLPGMPDALDRRSTAGMTIRAGQIAVVDEFRDRGDDP